MRLVAILLASCIAAPAFAQVQAPTCASVTSDSNGAAALALFQRDAVLNYWALKHYDADDDISLSAPEAEAAADGLKAIADADSDGRVTTYEFDRAREFIVARF
jgi:hypothetical protein